MWANKKSVIFWWPVFLLFLSGCGQQIDLIAPGIVVRLAQPTDAYIATYSGRDAAGNTIWTAAANKVTLPAGYYVAPPPPATQPTSSPP